MAASSPDEGIYQYGRRHIEHPRIVFSDGRRLRTVMEVRKVMDWAEHWGRLGRWRRTVDLAMDQLLH